MKVAVVLFMFVGIFLGVMLIGVTERIKDDEERNNHDE